MANEIRVRSNHVAGALDATLLSGGTSMSSPGLADLPAIGGTEHAALSIYTANSDGRVTAKEIVYVTAHTASATTATIARGKEGTTAAGWVSGDKWVHGPLASDLRLLQRTTRRGGGDLSTSSATRTPIDATNLAYLTLSLAVGDVVRCSIYGTWSSPTSGTEVYVDFEVDQPTSANTYTSTGEDKGCGEIWIEPLNYNFATTFLDYFTATEAGVHGFRPVWFKAGGNAVLRNAASGSGDVPIHFTVERL